MLYITCTERHGIGHEDGPGAQRHPTEAWIGRGEGKGREHAARAAQGG